MNKIRVSAKTKEEAITKALIELGTTSDKLGYDVLVQGTSGLFGIGAKPWFIEAYVREENKDDDLSRLESEIKDISSNLRGNSEKSTEDQAVKPAEPKQTAELDSKSEMKPLSNEKPKRKEVSSEYNEDRAYSSERSHQNRSERRGRHSQQSSEFHNRKQGLPRGGYEISSDFLNDAAPSEPKPKKEIKPISKDDASASSEKAVKFLKSVFDGMKLDVNLKNDFDFENNELQINIDGPDMGILIGKRGQTLDSLQYLTSLVVNKDHRESYIRVKLDTEDYRKRREQTLRNLARNISFKVKRTHKPIALEPMNPYERRIIHSALQNDRYCTTRSEGEEPLRHVIIYLKKADTDNSRK